jgi:serine/threonine protein kinase
VTGPSTHPPPARIGRYEIQRELGRGAMGVVYEAQDPLLGRNVAVKTIRLGFTTHPDERAQFEQRFFSEARAVARLSHPAIIAVHDVGQDTDSGDLFIALEFLKGRTLTDVVMDGGAMGWREALRTMHRLAMGLHHAHENGVVHRDVKPDNVMLLDSGEPKLMDFGIAKVEATQLTVAGQIFGTPRYMSPEQALGEPADARSDLFALGSLAYFLLTGHHAFGAPTIPMIITEVVHSQPVAPSVLVSTLPQDVDRIVGRLLAKRPEERYADGRAVAEDIDEVLANRPPRHADALPPHWARPSREDESLLEELLVEDDIPEHVPEMPAPMGAIASPQPRAAGSTTPPVAPPGFFARRQMLIAGAIGVSVVIAALIAWPREPNVEPSSPGLATPPASAPNNRPGSGSAPPQVVSDVEEQPLSEGQSRIRFALTHPLRRGRVQIAVDGQVVFEDDLEGHTTRKLRFIKTSKGRLATDIDVPAGEHTVRVEVAWEDERKAKSVRSTFEAGATRHLDAELGGLLRKSLTLDLN